MWEKLLTLYRTHWLDRPYRPGQTLGGYTIRSVLGVGSYGIAYLASPLHADTQVVVKQTKPSRRGHPKGLGMQLYEKKILESLDHPQIPQVVEHFVQNDVGFLVMSYIPGITVEELLFDKGQQFGEAEAVRLICKLARIVDHLHQHDIIHRDVRIPNVVMQNGEPYLIDFGLARFIGDSPTYTDDPFDHYPAEKQLKRAVHPSSDLLALGHFLLFLLYSTYEADESEAERSWQEELSLSPPLRTILQKLFQIDGSYSTVAELIDDLDHFLHI
ncbi:protein kinase [Brevibacillus humidisoli]|uniref:serine/threonine protein kinase n=1 Tax=Brevibacillus humidisoli TaxID=2895522 RepID=UPI001E380591|nr:protein kinase [Brevibacillus humidisoli]UFJ42276.1 protein kinase [Brevibacillus humidisoli]